MDGWLDRLRDGLTANYLFLGSWIIVNFIIQLRNRLNDRS